MLKRYQEGKTGPYSQVERSEIRAYTRLLGNLLTYKEESVTELERDYLRFYRRNLWYHTGIPFLAGAVVAISLGVLSPVQRLHFLPRTCLRVGVFGAFVSKGLSAAEENLLEFPLLDQVIAEAAAKHSSELNNKT